MTNTEQLINNLQRTRRITAHEAGVLRGKHVATIPASDVPGTDNVVKPLKPANGVTVEAPKVKKPKKPKAE